MSNILYRSSQLTDAYGAGSPSQSGNNNQKKMVGITAATLLLGGGVGLVISAMGKTKPTEPGGTNAGPETEPVTPQLPTEVDAAGKVTDQMSFTEAFAAARDEVGMGGVFNWHGRWYNTFEKEEWDGLSLSQRQEYVEMLTGEKLPVKPYHPATAAQTAQTPADNTSSLEPTVIEGYLNGQRVMGLDVDHDGTIDALVLQGADGYTYRVIDQSGDDGLDMLYRYNPINGELMQIERIEEPFILTNDQFSAGLEASMSREVIESVLETDDVLAMPDEAEAIDETKLPPVPEATDLTDDDTYQAGGATDDGTYVNDGNVQDME